MLIHFILFFAAIGLIFTYLGIKDSQVRKSKAEHFYPLLGFLCLNIAAMYVLNTDIAFFDEVNSIVVLHRENYVAMRVIFFALSLVNVVVSYQIHTAPDEEDQLPPLNEF